MNDNYSHNDLEIIYAPKNIQGPIEKTPENEDLQSNYNSVLVVNCNCINVCMENICKCLELSRGSNYDRTIYDGDLTYTLHQKLKDSHDDYPIIECNSNCSCPPTCGNRVVQNGPIKGLLVKLCDDKRKGMGLFTTSFIRKGSFICEYAGELLTRTQAFIRSEENDAQGKMNYIFCMNEYVEKNVIQTFVDPSKFGNIGRYINHSCDPNSRVVPVRSETIIPHLAIFAVTHIWPGEEITFNYGSTRLPGPDLFPYAKKKECYCDTARCTKVMPFENF